MIDCKWFIVVFFRGPTTNWQAKRLRKKLNPTSSDPVRRSSRISEIPVLNMAESSNDEYNSHSGYNTSDEEYPPSESESEQQVIFQIHHA